MEYDTKMFIKKLNTMNNELTLMKKLNTQSNQKITILKVS